MVHERFKATLETLSPQRRRTHRRSRARSSPEPHSTKENNMWIRKSRVNGLDLDALGEVVDAIEQRRRPGEGRLRRHHPLARPDPQRDDRRRLHHRPASAWRAATRSSPTSRVSCSAATSAPNPQELLMAAVNACMTVGYVAGAALKRHHARRARDQDPRHARPARLPRPR